MGRFEPTMGLGALLAFDSGWTILIALLVAGALIGGIAYALRRRSAPGGAPASGLGRLTLLRAWWRFRRQLPREARSKLDALPHFVVLGEAGSGKSELIRRGVGWERRARQFYPSLTDNPWIAFYLGGEAVAVEISPALNADTSSRAMGALRILFWALYRRRPPTVVIALDPHAWQSRPLDALRDHADLIRAKVGILAKIRGWEIRTHLALTHADGFGGFLELAEQVRRQRWPLAVELDEADDTEALLEAGIGKWRPLLPAILASARDGGGRGTEAFERALGFFARARQEWIVTASLFLRRLEAKDILVPRPALGRLYFTAPALGEVGHPFHVVPSDLEDSRDRRQTWHRVLAAAAVAVFAGLPLWVYGVSATQQWRADAQLSRLEAAPDWATAVSAEKSLPDLGAEWPRLGRLAKILPHVDVAGEEAATRARFASAVRQGILLPALREVIASGDTDRITYTLGALYAASGTDLGHSLLRRPAVWSTEVGIPPDVLSAYVMASDVVWQSFPDVGLRGAGLDALEARRIPHSSWVTFLKLVRDRSDDDFLLRRDLELLQRLAAPLGDALAEAERTRDTRQVAGMLLSARPELQQAFSAVLVPSDDDQWVYTNLASLTRIVRLVTRSSIAAGSPDAARGGSREAFNLEAFLARLEPYSQGADAADEISLETLPGARFHLNLDRLDRLIARSSVRALTKAYLDRMTDDGDIFFANPEEYDPVHLATGGGDLSYFPGRAFVPGIYTKVAYRREVEPLLRDLEARLDRVSFAEADREMLKERVQRAARAYSEAYAKAWEGFYQAFRVNAPSAEALEIVLAQMSLPRSPLYEMLEVVSENTNITEASSVYLRPMARRLSGFSPIHSLVTTSQGSTDIERARALISRMKEELAAAQAAAPPPETKAPETQEERPWYKRWFGGDEPQAEAVEATPDPRVPINALAQRQQIEALEAELTKLESRREGNAGTQLYDYESIMDQQHEELLRRDRLTLSATLEDDAPEGADLLAAQLSPRGRLAVEAMAKGETTFKKQVDAWLDGAGITSNALRQPFHEVDRAALSVGIDELEQVVSRSWCDLLYRPVMNRLRDYPFNLDAERELTLDALEAAVGPDAVLWRRYEALIAPLLLRDASRGTLRTRPTGLRAVETPDGMLETLASLLRLRAALWDDLGNRKPVVIKVEPWPLGRVDEEGFVPTLSYITLGESSVFGFNQRPSPEDFSVRWWDQRDAVVGVEQTRPSGQNATQGRRTSTLRRQDSQWALFRLLDAAHQSGDKGAAYTWSKEAGQGDGGLAVPITFVISPDPRQLFRLPGPVSCEGSGAAVGSLYAVPRP